MRQRLMSMFVVVVIIGAGPSAALADHMSAHEIARVRQRMLRQQARDARLEAHFVVGRMKEVEEEWRALTDLLRKEGASCNLQMAVAQVYADRQAKLRERLDQALERARNLEIKIAEINSRLEGCRNSPSWWQIP